MHTNGNTNKKTTIFSPRITSLASASSSGKQGKHGTAQGQMCCFGKCVKMGSSVSQPHQQNQQATAKVEQQQERHGEQSSKNGKSTVPSPRTPTPVHHQLETLIDEAKNSGWYIEPHEIEFQEIVAEGSTARVYKGTWRGLDVAVKCIFPEYFHNNEGAVLFFTQELDTLSRQSHRSVLQLMGACLRPPDHGWLVTEFLSTTLKEWLHGRGERGEERTAPLPPFWERLAKALEIAEAMQYLHDQRPMVIHRDLKPSNIFLDDAKHVRVADFGNARFLCDGEKALSGTFVYMAPEVIRSQPYNEKCDVFSFGIILNELITGEYPYVETEYGPFQIASGVCGQEKLRPALPKKDGQIMKELVHLILLSWNENPSIRPSFAKIASTLKRIQSKPFESIPI
ncbi:hypothetical protein AAG906_002484 [Vitis piasezkii]